MPASFASLDSESETHEKRNPHRFSRCGKRSSGGDIGLKVGMSDFGTISPYKEWIDVGLGATLTMAQNAEFFFDADLELGIDQKAFHANGRGGVRFNW